jgi:hypothetical protein
MKNSAMTRTRDRSQEALNRREQTFDVSTNRIFFQFEQMKMQTNEKMNSAMKRVIHRANSVSRRSRERDRRDRAETARSKTIREERIREETIRRETNRRATIRSRERAIRKREMKKTIETKTVKTIRTFIRTTLIADEKEDVSEDEREISKDEIL